MADNIMPGSGYSTLGLKPSVLEQLANVTDTFYPGMFFPSTLIILMNEVKLGRYTVEIHKAAINMSGRYSTLTIRSDIKEWLNENYERHKEEYEDKYHTSCFSHFINYFLANLFTSKFDAQGNVIRLQESDFEWLRAEYDNCKAKPNGAPEAASFERFVDSYVNEILNKMRTAKEILSV